MASSSARPHRQARSAFSYRDLYFGYEDDLSLCRRLGSSSSPAIATTSKKSPDPQQAAKKNLALKPIRNRANAKERAEAVQLQRAINKSLTQRSADATGNLQRGVHYSLQDRSADLPATSAINCMDDHASETLIDDRRISADNVDATAQNDCLAFQCLLDVATVAVLKGSVHIDGSHDTREGLLRGQPEEDQKQSEVTEEVYSDSSHDWEKGSSGQVDNEDESSDLSDESGSDRRTVKLQQKTRKAAVNDGVFPVQVKKARSVRPLLKLEVSTENCKMSVATPWISLRKASSEKENTIRTFTESAKRPVSNSKQQGAVDIGPTAKSCRSLERFQCCEMNKSQLCDSGSATQQRTLNMPMVSSTLLHRRIIGLSRRYRPPPLHPYLPKREG